MRMDHIIDQIDSIVRRCEVLVKRLFIRHTQSYITFCSRLRVSFAKKTSGCMKRCLLRMTGKKFKNIKLISSSRVLVELAHLVEFGPPSPAGCWFILLLRSIGWLRSSTLGAPSFTRTLKEPKILINEMQSKRLGITEV